MEISQEDHLISSKDTFFVAGHNGLAGSAICRSLRKKGYSNIITKTRQELDLLNKNFVDNFFSKVKPEVVILAAAKVGGILANSKYPADFLIENLTIQNNIIDACLKNKVKRLLFLGSSCIYPKFADQPIKEESLLSGFLENTNEAYAIAKIAGIKLCESFRKQYKLDSICLMPTNLYGPKDNFHVNNSHVMASLIRKFCEAKKLNYKKVECWGTGSPKREFLHVDDLGDACVFALEKWSPSFLNAPKDKNNMILNYLNVGTGEEITIKELSGLIAELVGFKGEVIWDKSKPDGTPRKVMDSSRFMNLGWKPNIRMRQGIKKTIEYYLTEKFSE